MMCQFLSFIIEKNGGLKYCADNNLNSHGDAVSQYSLTGKEYVEGEWDDDDNLELRFTEKESSYKAEKLEALIRGQFPTRYDLARHLIIGILHEGRMPNINYLIHPKWDDKTQRLYACWCVRNTPLADGRTLWDLLTDERSRNAVAVAEHYANGEATDEELKEAGEAAWAAGAAAWAAARAAREAAWAAGAAARAAGAAARAAGEAARAAGEAAREAQAKHLLEVLGE